MQTISKEQLLKRAEDLRLRNAMDLLYSYATTDKEIEAVVKMHKNNASVKDYILALNDGLRFGNWPWVEPTTSRALMNNPIDIWVEICRVCGTRTPCACAGHNLDGDK